MSSEVEICNIALDFLGSDRIMSLNDGTKPANLCLLNYAITRDEVLQSYPWNFAIRRANLSADATPPVYEWDYQYQLPTGPNPLKCLNVLDTANDIKSAYKNWVVEDTKILTNRAGPLFIRYIAQITDTNKFDSLFVTALAAKLAVNLAANLTESAGRIDQARIWYEKSIAQAMANDAATGKSGRMTGTLFIDSRGEWLVG